MTDEYDITNGLDLLGDWLDAKGYGEEAGLCTRAMDEINKLRAALKPFADVAENDICDSLTDADIFRPMTREYSRAEMLTCGHLRAAAAALKETDNGPV